VIEDGKADGAITHVISNFTQLNSLGTPEIAEIGGEENVSVATTKAVDDPFQNASLESSERSKSTNASISEVRQGCT